MRLSKRVWQAIGLGLFLCAVLWGTCGLLLYTIPEEPLGNMTTLDSTHFEITRACCIGPALSLIFLGYIALKVAHRHSLHLHGREIVSALAAAFGLVLVLMGLSVLLAPASGNPPETKAAFAIFFLLPGIFIMGTAAIFWVLFAQEE